MRTQIFVEKQRLDLYKDIAAEFTFSVDDIKDFSSRNTAYSKTIVIPGNATNNKIFGHVFEFGSANPYDPTAANVDYNYNASRSAACVVLIENIQIFKGIIRLLEVIIDNGLIEYECAVFGELGGFVDAMGNSRLEDLDFSDYDHAWTLTNIQNSWDASGSGYYYPLIDYGKVSTDKHDYDVKALRPALFVKEYIEKIIDNSGYTYECPFFSSSLFRRLIIPNNSKEMRQISQTALSADAEVYTYNGFPNDVRWTTGTLGDFTLSGTIYTYSSPTPFTSNITIKLKGTIVAISPYDNTCSFVIRKNGAIIATASFVVVGSMPYYFDVQIDAPNVTFTDGDTLGVAIQANVGDWTISEGTLNVQSTDPAQLIAVNYGDTIMINSHLPKGIFQRDFFTSIVKMFNLYVLEDSAKPKHLIIKPYIDYYQGGEVLLDVNDFFEVLLVNQSDALLLEDGAFDYLDWTYKVDRSKPMKLKPMSELNGRYFEFKYKPDIDWYNEQYQKKYSQGYGDRIEDTGYEFAKDKKTAELIFSATPLVGYVGEDKIVSSVFKLNNAVEDRTEHNIRILQSKKILNVDSWALKNGATTIANLSNYGYAGHLNDPDDPKSDLNFGAPKELYFDSPTYPTANLFNGFWSDYVAEITDKDSKLLSCYVYLKESDIYSLDFARLIYIDGALWRLNTVQDYDGESATKCTFLRVLNTTYA